MCPDEQCHSCGYDLDGSHGPFCPECGVVMARTIKSTPTQAARCLACGYDFGLASVERCPECGSADVLLGVHTLADRIRRTRWLTWRLWSPGLGSWWGVPAPLAALGLIGAASAAMALLSARTSFDTAGLVRLFALVSPALAAGGWRLARRRIEELDAGTLFLMLAATLAVSTILLLMGLLMLIG